jgi:hypothetical protein
MKMHVRVASDQSLKMLLHCLRVATSDPHATASEDNVSTWLCSCRCLTNADFPRVCPRTNEQYASDV